MNLPTKTYETQREKQIDFAIGFVSWFVLNAIMAGLVIVLSGALADSAPVDYRTNDQQLRDTLLAAINCIPWVLNLAALIFFGIKRAWIAIGMLGAFGFVFLCVLLAGIAVAAVCFGALVMDGMN
jgi:hypothetical protein